VAAIGRRGNERKANRTKPIERRKPSADNADHNEVPSPILELRTIKRCRAKPDNGLQASSKSIVSVYVPAIAFKSGNRTGGSIVGCVGVADEEQADTPRATTNGTTATRLIV